MKREHVDQLAALIPNGKSIDFKPGSVFVSASTQAVTGVGDEFEDVTKRMAALISNTIATIKQEVIPEMDNAVKDLTTIAEMKVKHRNDNLVPDIVKFSFPEFILNKIESGHLRLREYAGIPQKAVRLPKNNEWIKTVRDMTTDGDELDFLNGMSMEQFERIGIMFGNPSAMVLHTYANFINYDKTNKDDIFLIYLVASRLKGNPPTGTKGDLSDYNSVMDAIIAISGKIILSLHKTYEIALNRRIMPLANNTNSTIVPLPVYEDFISRNGDVDALLGLWSKKMINVSIDNILSKEELVKDWNLYVGMQMKTNLSSTADMLKAIYYNYFINSSKVEVNEDLALPNYKKEITIYLNKATPDTLMDTVAVVKHIMANILYNRIKAGKFIEIVESNKAIGMDTQSAVTLAITEFVTSVVLMDLEIK